MRTACFNGAAPVRTRIGRGVIRVALAALASMGPRL